jgi:hypothetical protein
MLPCRFSRVLHLLLCIPTLVGCSRREIPNDFRVEVTDVIASTDPVKVTVRVVDEDRRLRTGTDEYPFSAIPAGLAKVDVQGTLNCLRSGDGAVQLTLGPNTRTAPFKCRLVEKVDASDVGRVELTAGPFKPKIRILGKGGQELDGVDLMLTSRNTGVLFPRGSDLVPQMVGTATVIARAGLVTQEFRVDVVRKVTPEALPLEQNRKVFYSLESGKYELAVKLPAPRRLVAQWREAPYCNYNKESQDHVMTCVLRTKGGVVFDNPAYLMRGATDISIEGVSLFEVPD